MAGPLQRPVEFAHLLLEPAVWSGTTTSPSRHSAVEDIPVVTQDHDYDAIPGVEVIKV